MRGWMVVPLALAAGCAAQQPDIRPSITPAAIAAAREPLLFVELPEAQAIMSLAGRNGEVVTWTSADGRAVSLRDGVLVATRGFGFDLMSADVAGTLAALNGGPRDYERFASYLDGENRTILRSFACVMAEPVPETIDSFGRQVAVMMWVESCRSLDGDVEARFWRAGDETWRAVQPVSDRLGSVLTERLTGE